MHTLLLLCRPGFERECAQEIVNLAQDHGVIGEADAETDSGLVSYVAEQDSGAAKLAQNVRVHDLVFARQFMVFQEDCKDLPKTDRVTPIVKALTELKIPIAELIHEWPDTNEAKQISGMAKRLEPILDEALRAKRLFTRRGPAWRVHLLWLAEDRCVIGSSDPSRSSPHPGGIVRLSMPAGAPSRSVLKLAEAFDHFVDEEAAREKLKAGRKVYDLGASPGGWSWHLASRGLLVTAVDNGPIAKAVLDTDLVEHVKADGFTFRPPRPVQWMVCDIADRPARVANLVADWIARGHCRDTIFNLKLPMKRRYESLEDCRKIITSRLKDAKVEFRLSFKQLYHDREEVTGYLRRLPN